MNSKQENSFGARLLRAQEVLSYLPGFQNYFPPRPEESMSGYGELINQIVLVNAEEAQTRKLYNTSVSLRFKAFRKDEGSVLKLLPLIRGQVLSQFGKNSIEFNQIDRIIFHIRNTKVSVKEATEDTPEIKISQSEQSYGSLTQYFNDLINTLLLLEGFNPSNPMIQIGTLQSFAAQINQMNVEAAVRFQQLRDWRKRRRALYEQLRDRTQRSKSYSKANYGTKSS